MVKVLAARRALQPLPPPLLAGAEGLSPRGPAGARTRLRRLEPRLLLLPRRDDDRQPRRRRQPDRLPPRLARQRPGAATRGSAARTEGLPYVAGKPHGVRHLPRPPRQRPPALPARRPAGALPHLPLDSTPSSAAARRTAAATTSSGADPVAAPRAEVPLKVAGAFRTRVPRAVPACERGKDGGGWHWDLGGHLSDGGAGCASAASTCHAVHGDEATAPLPKLLALEPVNDVANLFCEGCHAGTRGDGRAAPPHPNPGGTTAARTYHPADDDESNGSGRFLEIREPPGGPSAAAARGACSARPATRRTPPRSRRRCCARPQTAADFCEECHDQVPPVPSPRGRRRTRCAADRPSAVRQRRASCPARPATGRTTPVSAQQRESDFVPLLRDSLSDGALCERLPPRGQPDLRREARLPGLALPRRPGAAGDLQRHRPAAAPRPVAGVGPALGLRRGERQVGRPASPATRSGRGRSSPATTGSSRDLLARSGNPVEWAEGQETTYLCTGCHSVDPATAQVKGHSHPMMNAERGETRHDGRPPDDDHPPDMLNCDSCHRPHEAATAGGRYILEAARRTEHRPAGDPPQDRLHRCLPRCHAAGTY